MVLFLLPTGAVADGCRFYFIFIFISLFLFLVCLVFMRQDDLRGMNYVSLLVLMPFNGFQGWICAIFLFDIVNVFDSPVGFKCLFMVQ